MMQIRYNDKTFRTLSDFIAWAKVNGIRVITEVNREVVIHNDNRRIL